MLKGTGCTQLQRRLPCAGARAALRPVRHARGLGPVSPLASSAAVFTLDDCSGQQEQAAPQLLSLPAARVVSIGRELVASCAAFTLASAVFQLVATYVSKARDAVAAALPTPSGSGEQQQDVVELMSPVYTLGHAKDTSMFWTTTDIMCYFDGH
ncbi:hypothetical protein TSOC_001626 [Tetrabaena socialis]|uniref:Uncharacterized protein n=1 Tax=Tetrabaena socialis TaxID=47790 RepID=A0A2J8AG75_9CHLO|nr:hypothetical protein TSOC_001626 [Tetrabaena socialis]|eukprot:PNH11502.1 hypothetical protein TSOC_001626 [Tetrabaena socialis]